MTQSKCPVTPVLPQALRSTLTCKTDLRLDYQHLHLDVSGPETAPPVLLLHGWGSSAQLMHPVADTLADRYRVYTPARARPFAAASRAMGRPGARRPRKKLA